jgi:hypothetical protein
MRHQNVHGGRLDVTTDPGRHPAAGHGLPGLLGFPTWSDGTRSCPPSPADITADLAACSAMAGLSQPLTYLMADTARGQGRVYIAPAACPSSSCGSSPRWAPERPSRSSTSPARAAEPYEPSAAPHSICPPP